jgi:hypothetical protein
VLLESVGVFPSVEYQQESGFDVAWMNLLALGYRVAFGVLAAFVTAALAPSNPARHVRVLAVMATVFAVVSNVVVSMVPATEGVLPVWFSVALVLTAYPSAWLGGQLHQVKVARNAGEKVLQG